MRNKLLLTLGVAAMLVACETGTDSGVDASHNVNVSKAAAPGTPEDFKANAGDRVFFALNMHGVTAESKRTLESQAAWLKTYPNTKATVEGHCDERGTREYNLALGGQRAHAAMHTLVGLGINKDRLKTISYGKDKAPVAGTGEAVWAQNRTAITVVE